MFNRSKKGVSAAFEALMGVIVMILVIVLIAFIFKSISDAASESAENAQCKASVTAYAKFNDLPEMSFGNNAKADSSMINCPTKYVTIKSGTAKQMNRDIADLMVECWDNFGRGELKLFDATDEKFCAICSVFQFDDKTTQLKGLPLFMMTEKSPIKVGGRRLTYHEFLLGKQTSSDVVDQAKTNDLSFIDGSKRYAVLFTYYKKSYWSKIKSAIVGAASGAIAGAVIVIGTAAGLAIAGATFGVAAPVSTLIVTGSIAAGAAIGTSSANEKSGLMTPGADWDANIIMSEYSADQLSKFGCQSLPVSQLDARFK